jgi:hypothetical protein
MTLISGCCAVLKGRATHAAAGPPVSAKEEPLTLPWHVSTPNYKSDPNAAKPFAPLKDSHKSAGDRVFRTIVLENQFTKVQVIPELGGVVARAIHKPSGDDFFYFEQKAKDWLPWWESGVKVSFPYFEHISLRFESDPVSSATAGRCGPNAPLRLALPRRGQSGRVLVKAGNEVLLDYVWPPPVAAPGAAHDRIKAALKGGPLNAEMRGSADEQGQTYQSAIKAYPDGSADRGRCLYRDGQLAAATECLTKATAANKDDGEAWHLLGAALLEQAKRDDALAAFAKARELKYTAAGHFIALDELARDQRGMAQMSLHKVVQAIPAHWEARLLALWLQIGPGRAAVRREAILPQLAGRRFLQRLPRLGRSGRPPRNPHPRSGPRQVVGRPHDVGRRRPGRQRLLGRFVPEHVHEPDELSDGRRGPAQPPVVGVDRGRIAQGPGMDERIDQLPRPFVLDRSRRQPQGLRGRVVGPAVHDSLVSRPRRSQQRHGQGRSPLLPLDG